MSNLKPFSLWKRVSQRLDLQVVTVISVLAGLITLVGGYISYSYGYKVEEASAHKGVNELVQAVSRQAAIAAYLNDDGLATQVIEGLEASVLVEHAVFFLGDGHSIGHKQNHDHFSEISPDLRIELSDPFNPSQSRGSLDIYTDHAVIAERAQHRAYLVLRSQGLLLLTVIISVFIAIRYLVIKPIRDLAVQLRQINIIHPIDTQRLSVKNASEIGFLTHRINRMLGVIQQAYITERKHAEHISYLEKQFRLIFERSRAGIVLLNAENRITLHNQAFVDVINPRVSSSLIGKRISDLFKVPCTLENTLAEVRSTGTAVFKDLELDKDEQTWLRGIFSMIEPDEPNGDSFVEIVFYDISDRALIEREFRHVATHDPLTGLMNRRGAHFKFAEQAERAEREEITLAIFMLDLNDFKPVNDTYGHESGDVVLKEISQRFKEALRSEDVLVRWGGDEFVITMLIKNAEFAVLQAQKMMRCFNQPIQIAEDLHVSVSTSIGIACSSVEEPIDIEQLLDNADQAMYVVKNNGKRNYHLYGDPLSSLLDRQREKAQQSSDYTI